MILANYHSHLAYCNHAGGHAKDYIEEAIKHGLKEIGISDHAPMLEIAMGDLEYRKPMLLDQMYRYYLPELQQAKEEYKDKIKVLSGFETEYLEGNAFFIPVLRRNVDYLNLGIHYYDYEGKLLSPYASMNSKEIYGYLDACIKGMETGLFNTLVHPDLFQVGYHDENGNRTFDSHCEFVSRKIIECAIRNQVYLEINVNGINNSRRFTNGDEWVYPCKEFWRIASEYPDLKIIIGTDAHSPKDLVHPNIKLVEEFIKELGLKVDTFMKIYH